MTLVELERKAIGMISLIKYSPPAKKVKNNDEAETL
jgi:hypothetical protein